MIVAGATTAVAQDQPATAQSADASAITAVVAQPLLSQHVTATGRVVPMRAAKIGPRLGGFVAEFGKDSAGRTLDVGMNVKKGDVLFRLEMTTVQNAVAAAEAGVKVAAATLANLKAPPREERQAQLVAAVAEIETRLADKAKDEERYRRLVEDDKTMPKRRLEEVQTEVTTLKLLKGAAEARLREAKNGPTPTEIAVAEAQVQQAQAMLKSAQDDLRDATVVAGFDGVITQRWKSAGDFIPGGSENGVLELVSAEDLEVELRLPEAYYATVKPGKTQASVKSAILAEDLKLPVSRVVAAIEAGKGTFVVRVSIPSGRGGGLAPGAFVTADVEVDANRQGVIVPQRAVQSAEGRSFVFVAQEGKMLRRDVELGDRMTENVVVTSGLAAGQKVLCGPPGSMRDGAAMP